MQIPFFDKIASAEIVLIAGVGGGFDIMSGMPLYRYLRKLGKKVILANLSFSDLVSSNSEMITKGLYRITEDSNTLPYFPEKLLVQWLEASGEEIDMYAFSNLLGVAPLKQAYLEIITRHSVDTLIMVDGGTDSLMFGDESGVGTIIEDSCSLVAASNLPVKRSFLVATAFSVEQHHNLNHYSCLENISTVIKADGYHGVLSLTKEMEEGRYYIELVEYLNEKQPRYMSIVANSISSAIQGEFGDHHSTSKTKGSIQFINPIMGLYWFFDLESISSRIKFFKEIENTETMNQIIEVFKLYRASTVQREAKEVPL